MPDTYARGLVFRSGLASADIRIEGFKDWAGELDRFSYVRAGKREANKVPDSRSPLLGSITKRSGLPQWLRPIYIYILRNKALPKNQSTGSSSSSSLKLNG
jgi:hypothetical protein